jgi:hypothetical protein
LRPASFNGAGYGVRQASTTEIKAVKRNESHLLPYLGGKEYRSYLRRLEQGESLSLMGPASCRYRDSAQLVELGLIRTSSGFESHARDAGKR